MFYRLCDLRVNLDLTKLRKEQLVNYRQTLLTQNRRSFAFINNECKIVVNDCSNSEQKPNQSTLIAYSTSMNPLQTFELMLNLQPVNDKD